jgi:hypothetical protein
MKRKIIVALVVLLALVGGYFYVRILLDAGSDIRDDISVTTDTVTTDTLAVVEKKIPMVTQVAQGLSVEGGLGTGVENRALIGEAAEFGADVGRVYCLITVSGADRPTEVAHVWYFKDKEKARTALPIKYKKHRTWSYKTIHPQHAGDWRVDVVDMSGKVLKSFPFVIGE